MFLSSSSHAARQSPAPSRVSASMARRSNNYYEMRQLFEQVTFDLFVTQELSVSDVSRGSGLSWATVMKLVREETKYPRFETLLKLSHMSKYKILAQKVTVSVAERESKSRILKIRRA